MKNKDIGKLRKSYEKKYIDDINIEKIPFDFFEKWFNDACKDKLIDEPNAMSLSTISSNGFPRTRIVLLKEFGIEGFIFYTNFNSRKGEELKNNFKASLCFHWKSLRRQVRVLGNVEEVTSEEADEYSEDDTEWDFEWI